jgi:hypothetical protein
VPARRGEIPAVSDLAPVLWRPPGELRQKLIEMRAELLSRMQRRGAVEPAHLPLVAGVAAALEALDRAARTEAAAPVAVDASGAVIRLVLLRDGGAVAAAPLSPVAAIRLAGELLDEAGLRLADQLAELRRKNSG